MKFFNKVLPAVFVLLLSFFIVSCGGSDESNNSTPNPNPAPPAPSNPGAPAPIPPPPVGLGGSLEAQSPGTPIGNDQASWSALYTRFNTNVRFYGNVTVSSVTASDYQLQQNNTFQKSNTQTLPNQTPTMQINAQGDSIFLQSQFGAQQFYFQTQVTVLGTQLKSTDVVGLYLSKDGTLLLKVNYNVKNPPIEYYQIQQISWYQFRVTQKLINTAGTMSY